MISMRKGGTVKSGEKPSSAHWDHVSSLISCSFYCCKDVSLLLSPVVFCASFCLSLLYFEMYFLWTFTGFLNIFHVKLIKVPQFRFTVFCHL